MDTERAYHHGDLRAALLARALEIVERQGHEAVSLRALAEALGVSRGAPYRHFPERDHLLAEVASAGFDRLSALTTDDMTDESDAIARLADAARRFLSFARENPQLFRLMYDTGLPQRADQFPHLAATQAAVYERIHTLYATAAQQAGLAGIDVKLRVIAFWSTIFGYAKIVQARLLQPYMTGDASDGEIEDQVIGTALGPGIVASAPEA